MRCRARWRGGGLPTAVPTDPTIYRFYEVLQVYGDGIMSAQSTSRRSRTRPAIA
jgi:cyanate lyase